MADEVAVKPIQDAILYASRGPMWNIYSITAGVIEEIQTMTGVEANQVVAFCEKLAAMRGGVPVIGKNFSLVQVPAGNWYLVDSTVGK